ncbi:exo-alpha-sialidase [Halomontanus rarus]|uniref:exo-alpha-sialidase n=1 Tax=Halomontanus rarus TaxID=3034020 RepID=UPI00293BA189|nr:exo-alpha-sialidase [Halovivax sp. KZCA124]
MEERWICHADDCASENVFHKNTTIYEMPNGDLVSAWFAGDVGEGNRDQNTYGSRLPVGADEWEDSKPLVEIDGRAVGSPVMFEGPGDYLWLTAPVMYGDWLSTSRVHYKRSSDGGETWGDLELLSERSGIYLKNKPLYLDKEDRWILPAYSDVEDKPYFFLLPGDDHERPGDFSPMVGGGQVVPHDEKGYMGALGMTHPTVVELSDGKLLAYLRPRQGGYVYETRSHDRGLNWTEAEQTDIPNPNAAFDMVRTEDGNVVLVINPVSDEQIPEGRNVLGLFMSEDEGDTWPYQLYLERVETDQSLRKMPDGERPEFTYGNVIQADDGRIHLAYEHRRRGIKHVETTEDEIRDLGTEDVLVEALFD